MSSAVSAQYPHGCTTCGAGPRQPCRTLRTGRVTDTHLARIQNPPADDPAGDPADTGRGQQ